MIDTYFDGEKCWPGLPGLLNTGAARMADGVGMALLTEGVSRNGRPDVLVRLNLPDGGVSLTIVSLEDLRMALLQFEGRLQFLAREKFEAAFREGKAPESEYRFEGEPPTLVTVPPEDPEAVAPPVENS